MAGTVEIRGLPETTVIPQASWDPRSACFRAPAVQYAPILRALSQRGEPVDDQARSYETLSLKITMAREPRPYQREALDAWLTQRGRGVVVLPTGAGKTHVAVMAMVERPRSTLVVAPTLDLVRQWYDLLRTTFDMEIGLIGGGEYNLHPVTVTTYDSAHLHMEHLGARFGLVVFDECHHLPSGAYAHAARACLAPFRLGLTATPERNDGRERDLTSLVGPIVYRRAIGDLVGDYLAEYDTAQLLVPLSEEERAEYEKAREAYRGFLRAHGISMRDPAGWATFIRMSARSEEGRAAMRAYRRQRELAFSAPGKLERLRRLLDLHNRDHAIVFTQDNAIAYRIATQFLLPIITHQTKVKERSEILERFAKGTYGAIVTSKVLNEGVDVPDANVAIVISGSGSVREHVQRLGRVLRRQGDKQALLYELVSEGTSEALTSERRRDHDAYR